jgi:uncharacterized protein with NRDE domain
VCLIVFALRCHPRYRLVLAANRDEYRDRPTAPAGFWDDAPAVVAGRDLQAGGTWLGLTVSDRFAAVTNYRDPRQQVMDPPSRGKLVADFLQDEASTVTGLTGSLMRRGDAFDGFNLLYGSTGELYYFTNRGGSSGPVPPGVHSLSNHLLDSSWPKQRAARERLAALLARDLIDLDDLLRIMLDPSPFADHLLPDTGVGPDLERFLSPILICGERYATRSTTVLTVSVTGETHLRELCHDPPGGRTRDFMLALPADRP